MVDFVKIGVPGYSLMIIGLFTLLALRLFSWKRIPEGLRLPPGPPRLPIVGNLFDMPTQQEWVTFFHWAKKYGDIVYLKTLGQSIVVINSTDVAYDLFVKRSSIYSDRGEFPMVRDLMDWNWALPVKHYGDEWRSHRRVIHHKFHPDAVAKYQPIQLKHTRILLRRLHDAPDDFVKHLRHTSGAITMEVVYGIKVQPENDPFIINAEKAIAGIGEGGVPGAFLVDMIPILKYVPEWFPGAGFQQKARVWREYASALRGPPFEAVIKALRSGTAEPSITASLLEEVHPSGHACVSQEVIRDTGGTIYAAGADTTVTLLHTFFLAMVLFPKVQQKAQKELDEVVGPSRLPDYEDRENLPYINALCKEVLRWHPVLPLGISHRVMEDDVFGRYFIPAGSLVVGNAWTLLHDEATYGADTDKFIPERFLTPGIKDPSSIAFGFGRRICPGRYFANNYLHMAVASILSVFDITHPRDHTGKDIPIACEFESGLFSCPKPFRCTISPRSQGSKELILEKNSYRESFNKREEAKL